MATPPPTGQPDRTLERQERIERAAASRRAIQRNESQARGEFERGRYDYIVDVTGLLLRGQTLLHVHPGQIPLVYWRGRAFEALGRHPEAAACYRALAAWDGGTHAVVDDARIYIALGMSRLLALDDTPATGCPARDTRVFPVTWLGPATFIGAALLTSALVVVAMTVIIALKIY